MRLEDWEARLNALATEKLNMPHAYGTNDCLLLAGAAVLAITGEDLFSQHVGKYKSKTGAAKYLRSLGFKSPAALVGHHLKEIPIGFAQRGDIVLIGGDGGWDIPALCFGHHALVIADNGQREGTFRLNRSDWLMAWAVGHE